MALQRSGWQGHYKGADIAKPLVDYLNSKCSGYDAVVHRDLTVDAPDASLDMVFHWSVFTHLYPEECYLYMADAFRALKPGGTMVFSFLEFENVKHHQIFYNRVSAFRKHGWANLLDTFLHRDWIKVWAQHIGFEGVAFTDGTDGTHHPEFWQALVRMTKPS
jgi:SAM-dependent methyltransferase